MAGRGHVRATAQVDKVALGVEGKVLIRRDSFQQLDLVLLTLLVEQLNSFVATHQGAGYLVVRFHQLLHLRFDLLQIFRGKRTLVGEVVVEAIFNNRTDSYLCRWEQPLNRHRHQVSTGVTDHFQAILITGGNDCQISIIFNGIRGIHQLTIDLTGQGNFCQASANISSNIKNGNGISKLPLAAIRKGNYRHVVFLSVTALTSTRGQAKNNQSLLQTR